MENHLSLNNLHQAKNGSENQTVSVNRMKALKSLAELLLHELEYLENLGDRDDAEKAQIGNLSLSSEVEHFEIELIRNALIQTGGHQRKAAELLNTKMTTLNAKMKRYGIDAHFFAIAGNENYA